jgi:hypothetical protein
VQFVREPRHPRPDRFGLRSIAGASDAHGNELDPLELLDTLALLTASSVVVQSVGGGDRG